MNVPKYEYKYTGRNTGVVASGEVVLSARVISQRSGSVWVTTQNGVDTQVNAAHLRRVKPPILTQRMEGF